MAELEVKLKAVADKQAAQQAGQQLPQLSGVAELAQRRADEADGRVHRGWSDRAGPGGGTSAQNNASGVAQGDYGFSKVFAQFR